MTARSKTGSSSKKLKREKFKAPSSAEVSSVSAMVAKQPVKCKCGKIIPPPSQMHVANVPRFEFVNQSLMYTYIMDKLVYTVNGFLPSIEDKMIDLGNLKPRKIYLYESFHLSPLFQKLKAERKDLRILYIDNCESTLDDYFAIEFILKKIFSAGTDKDKIILDRIYKLSCYNTINHYLRRLRKVFKRILNVFGEKFVIVLDQVNTVFTTKRNMRSGEKEDFFIELFGLKKVFRRLNSPAGRKSAHFARNRSLIWSFMPQKLSH